MRLTIKNFHSPSTLISLYDVSWYFHIQILTLHTCSISHYWTISMWLTSFTSKQTENRYVSFLARAFLLSYTTFYINFAEGWTNWKGVRSRFEKESMKVNDVVWLLFFFAEFIRVFDVRPFRWNIIANMKSGVHQSVCLQIWNRHGKRPKPPLQRLLPWTDWRIARRSNLLYLFQDITSPSIALEIKADWTWKWWFSLQVLIYVRIWTGALHLQTQWQRQRYQLGTVQLF